ncbi:AAA family ATPase [Pyrobaculum neutrophilum]|uniref:SMC domain protein n=1 Tax=Pyrobaculum neutrophilum (strain DSM 2338 / JCM 9278 / NBRC 100436 / V24Sta) TaxID=444157 RepID=B1Y9E0_PYRNV|nr:SMC family ATPase [Pyrobaculum neutrophilum]ACB40369.1 SMC domain protein [Pyrobaculum neutrophilum V24Sta]
MWRIERIELENFRSYKGRHELRIGDAAVFWGRIGAGKTSILYAIEYALFGRQLEVKERVARLVDLINADAQEARVALELRKGGELLRVERRLGRRGGERVVLHYGGVEHRGDQAEEKLAELLGADEDVYERLVYISHRTLEGFIYGTTQKRALSVDRLFGIDVVDGVIKAVSTYEKALLNVAEDLRKRLASYEKYREVIKRYGGYRGVEARLGAVEQELEALKKREEALSAEAADLAKRRTAYLEKIRENEGLLLEYYRAKSELEVLESDAGGDVDVSAVEKIREALREALEEYEHLLGRELAERLEKAADLESLSTAMSEAYEALLKLAGELEAQISETKKTYEQLLARAKRLDEEVRDAEAKLKRLEKSYNRFKELQRSFQSLDAARAALAEVRKRLDEVERSVAFHSALRTVALYTAETGAERCPLCGSPIDRRAALRVADEVEGKFGELIREAEALREKVRELEKAVDEMDALSGEVAEYLATKAKAQELALEREEVVKRVLQAEKSVKQLEKKAERLRALLARIDKRIIAEAVAKYGRALRARELRRRVKELEEALAKAGVGGETLDVEMRWREVVADLEKTSSRMAELHREKTSLEEVVREVGGDAESLKKKLDSALYAYGRLQELKAKLELAKVNARARLLEVARSKFNEVFLSLYKYGDLVGVNADLEQRRGYYEFYAVTPTGERYGISKLSDGQRLSIALALALALRDVSNIHIGFVIFDEPIPYVDVNIRKAFVDLVHALSNKYQIIVATQSREFADLIKNALNAKLYSVAKRESSEVREERDQS